MERCTAREAFCQALQRMTEALAAEVWTTVVEQGSGGADVWLRQHGSAWLRRVLGLARAERLGVCLTCPEGDSTFVDAVRTRRLAESGRLT